MQSDTDGPIATETSTILENLEKRVLWLSTYMIHHANKLRPNPDGMKVGGHQASCASVVSLMTALYFAMLRPQDHVAVKPHASPVFHAIQYLLGNLPRHLLTTLRDFGGLQAYPSRTKDPDGVTISTGSVGLGAAATIFGALTQRYVRDHFGHRAPGRYIALVGDA
jgi:pyruvate dehydrogenase E1 component